MSELRSSTSNRERRKRKWDVPGSGESEPSSTMTAVSSLLPLVGVGALPGVFPAVIEPTVAVAVVQQSAAAIVQKINQGLAARGVLPLPKVQDEVIAKEIVINDAEPGVRYKLTKRQTQEDIQSKTGAVVITRGRYKPPGGPADPGGEKPLYLHISAGIHLKDTKEKVKAVDQAVAIVEEMLKIGRFAQSPAKAAAAIGGSIPTTAVTAVGAGIVPGSGPGGGVVVGGGQANPHYPQQQFPQQLTLPSAVLPSHTAVVYAGFEADPSFNLPGRIRGPDDRFIGHISKETGAAVVLAGIGSGERDSVTGQERLEPLHLRITCSSQKALEEARWLAENLVGTIRTEYFRSSSGTQSPLAVENRYQPGVASGDAQLQENPSHSEYGVLIQQRPDYTATLPAAAPTASVYSGYPTSIGIGFATTPGAEASLMARARAGTVVDMESVRGSVPLPTLASTATVAHTGPTKRYSAVPPPPQLLSEQKVIATDSEQVAGTSSSANSMSGVGRSSDGNFAADSFVNSSGTFPHSSSANSMSGLPISMAVSSNSFVPSTSTLSAAAAASAASLFVSAASRPALNAQQQYLVSSYAQSAAAAAAASSPYSYAGYAVRPVHMSTPLPFTYGQGTSVFVQPTTSMLSTQSFPASFGAAAFLPGPPPLSASQVWQYSQAAGSSTSSTLTLHRPPPPVSVGYKTASASSSGVSGSVSSSFGSGGSSRSGDGKQSESNPPQRRRFQEFPKEVTRITETKDSRLKDAQSASQAKHLAVSTTVTRTASGSGMGTGVGAGMSVSSHADINQQRAGAGCVGGAMIRDQSAMMPPSVCPSSLPAKSAGAPAQPLQQLPPESLPNMAPSQSVEATVGSRQSFGNEATLEATMGSRQSFGNEASLRLVDYGEEEDDDGAPFSSTRASPHSRLKASAAAYGKPFGAA